MSIGADYRNPKCDTVEIFLEETPLDAAFMKLACHIIQNPMVTILGRCWKCIWMRANV
jgi:hypothetical protein